MATTQTKTIRQTTTKKTDFDKPHQKTRKISEVLEGLTDHAPIVTPVMLPM